MSLWVRPNRHDPQPLSASMLWSSQTDGICIVYVRLPIFTDVIQPAHNLFRDSVTSYSSVTVQTTAAREAEEAREAAAARLAEEHAKAAAAQRAAAAGAELRLRTELQEMVAAKQAAEVS